jgi:hypothetical protein
MLKSWHDELAYAEITERYNTADKEDEVIQEGIYKVYTEKEVQKIEKILNDADIYYWLAEPIRLNPNKKYMLWIEHNYSMFTVTERFGFKVEEA